MKKTVTFFSVFLLFGCQIHSRPTYYTTQPVEEVEQVEAEPVFINVVLDSEIPNADIYLNREFVCVAPCKQKLEVGFYEMDCQKNERHGSRYIQSNDEGNFFIDMKPRSSVDVEGVILCRDDKTVQKEQEAREKEEQEEIKRIRREENSRIIQRGVSADWLIRRGVL